MRVDEPAIKSAIISAFAAAWVAAYPDDAVVIPNTNASGEWQVHIDVDLLAEAAMVTRSKRVPGVIRLAVVGPVGIGVGAFDQRHQTAREIIETLNLISPITQYRAFPPEDAGNWSGEKYDMQKNFNFELYWG